jgi:hypothetical protein
VASASGTPRKAAIASASGRLLLPASSFMDATLRPLTRQSRQGRADVYQAGLAK